jgi:hypothetical protein
MRRLRLFGIEISRWSQSAESAFIRGMSLVRTDCSDEQIRDEIIEAAGGDLSAIEEAFTHVEDMRREQQSYVTDRALRVFTAAVRRDPVRPVDNVHVELYERERWLERLPREVAVAELCELSPAIRQYCEEARKKRNQYATANSRKRLQIEENMENEVDVMVGPRSRAQEPLLRSSITAGVVKSWVRDVMGLTID